MNPELYFVPPEQGFVSESPVSDWTHALLIGNGTMVALVMGHPHAETLHLSHASLYLPNPVNEPYPDMDMDLAGVRKLCLEGHFVAAAERIPALREKFNCHDARGQFLAACSLCIF